MHSIFDEIKDSFIEEEFIEAVAEVAIWEEFETEMTTFTITEVLDDTRPELIDEPFDVKNSEHNLDFTADTSYNVKLNLEHYDNPISPKITCLEIKE